MIYVAFFQVYRGVDGQGLVVFYVLTDIVRYLDVCCTDTFTRNMLNVEVQWVLLLFQWLEFFALRRDHGHSDLVINNTVVQTSLLVQNLAGGQEVEGWSLGIAGEGYLRLGLH